MVTFAHILVFATAAYVGLGLLFASAFVTTGVGRIDPSAVHAPIGFRVVIIPGTIALWPLLAIRWVRGQQPPVESTSHRRAAARRPSAASGSESSS